MKTFLVAALAAVAIATPMAEAPVKRAPDPGSIALIKKIAPASASCAGAPFPDECATAEQVTQPLIDGFAKYQITTPGEQASLLAWMLLESAEFRYNHNHYPGRPGQGTRCMMMPSFVKELGTTLGVSGTDDAQILTDVLAKGGDYEAAAWFYSTKCDDTIKKGVQAGTTDGYTAFITTCVQTTMTDDRMKYWKTTAAAFGLKV